MSDAAVIDNPVGGTQTPTVDAPPKSAMEQFTGLFGFGKKAPVEQPTQPNLGQPDLNSAGLGNTDSSLNVTPPAAEVIPSAPPIPEVNPENSVGNTPIATLNPDINTMDGLLAQGPQVVDFNPTVETAVPPETPADKLKQQIAASVDAFLKEVTKEKVPA